MTKPARQKVWDLPVRLFHWSLVIVVTLLWISGEFGGLDISGEIPVVGFVYLSNMDIHALLGQAVLVLVLFRILWGLVGSSTAKFSSFLSGPSRVFAELCSFLRGKTPQSLGHNALGGLMVVALLAVLAFQAVSGLFSADDFFFSGPLASLVSSDTSDRLTGLHKQSFSLLQVLIVLHIAAIFYYLVRGHNLVGPMLSGRKKMVAENREVAIAPWWRAMICFLVSLGGVYWLVNF